MAESGCGPVQEQKGSLRHQSSFNRRTHRVHELKQTSSLVWPSVCLTFVFDPGRKSLSQRLCARAQGHNLSDRGHWASAILAGPHPRRVDDRGCRLYRRTRHSHRALRRTDIRPRPRNLAPMQSGSRGWSCCFSSSRRPAPNLSRAWRRGSSFARPSVRRFLPRMWAPFSARTEAMFGELLVWSSRCFLGRGRSKPN